MTKIVLVGAGSAQFGAGMLGDIFRSQTLKDAEIVLHDINPKAVKKTKKMAQDYIDGHNLKQSVSVAENLPTALQGADFVVISIEVGNRFDLWDLDQKIPQQYGIHQVYGENGGPGGLFHSLRIIPPILEICHQVMEFAPKATVFNYSNPMSRICTTVHRKYPELNFIGMCHEISSLERHLPLMLGVERSEIHYRAGGLNHFSVLTEINYVSNGQSAYNDVRERAPEYFRNLPGYSEILNASRKSGKAIDTEGWMEIDTSHVDTIRPWSDRWLFMKILSHFGALPITSDSHFGEYIQWAYDCADHRGIIDFYTYYRGFLNQQETKIREDTHERVVPIIDGILSGANYEEPAVNIPNKGFVQDLPPWIVVEVPALVNSQGIQGILIDVPVGVRALLSNQIGVHNMTACAVLEKSKDYVIQALLVDPTVNVSKNIPEFVDHVIEEQSPWLDYLK